MQVDEPARGFSYKQDGPLDMRMDARIKLSAADHLARLSEAELSQLLWELADEEDHAAIARTIVLRRGRSPILRTHELTRLIFQAKGIDPAKHKQAVAKGEVAPHPAARTFQALRILVNNELASLRELLRVAPECLLPGGKIGLVTFHSGEDRLVKQAFAAGLGHGVYQAICEEPLRPSGREVFDNPRSRPARFRWAQKA